MSDSTFRINQPPGAGYANWDRSRHDIDLFSVASERVELEAQNTGMATYLWEVFSAPFGTTVVIAGPTSTKCDFEINSYAAGYLCRLTVDAGLPTESITELYFGVPLPGVGIPLPAFNETNQDNKEPPYTGARGNEIKLNAILAALAAGSSGTTITWEGNTVNEIEKEIFVDGVSERLTLDTNRTMGFDFFVFARNNTGNASKMWRVQGAIQRGAGDVELVGGVPPNYDIMAASLGLGGVTISVEADTGNQALVVKVTGAAGTDFDWYCEGKRYDLIS